MPERKPLAQSGVVHSEAVIVEVLEDQYLWLRPQIKDFPKQLRKRQVEALR
jgi:hypothetical protein